MSGDGFRPSQLLRRESLLSLPERALRHSSEEAEQMALNRAGVNLWWEWAEEPLDSMLTIPVDLHDAVMALSQKNDVTAPRSTRPRDHLPAANSIMSRLS